MRFVGVLAWSAHGTEKMTIVPPCEGYYTNISMQVYVPGWDDEDEAFQFYLGTELNEDIFDQMADAGGDRQITGDFTSSRGIYLKFPMVIDPAGDRFYYYKHWGNKKLFVNRGEVLHLMAKDPVATGTPYPQLLVQGYFVPKYGATLHQKFEGSLSESDDFGNQAGDASQNTNLYRFQNDLSNVQVKATITTTWATNNYEGIAYFKLQKRNQDWFEDTIADGRGDILDTDYIDQKYASLHSILGSIPFHTDATGPAGTESARVLTFTQVINVGRVKEGDFLTWDIEDIGADTTMNGTYVINLEIAGVISKKQYCKEGDFFQMPELYLNLNEHDVDLEMI